MDAYSITGACLCGAIRYKLAGSPLKRLLCHCNNCRRGSGAAFLTLSVFQNSQLSITEGEDRLTKYADADTDSGRVLERCFCSNCGSQMFAWGKDGYAPEDTVVIAVGSMDIDQQDFEKDWAPDEELFCISRRKWLPPIEGTIKKDKLT